MSVADTERAIALLLQSFGREAAGDLARTPARAAKLWHEHLLRGEGVVPADALGPGFASSSRSPVVMTNVAIHLVCPHDLTVGLGEAHVAYAPGGRLASFGALVRLIEACTCRLVLQEDASDTIASTLVASLGARAAVAVIEAAHPCHNVPRPRAHGSRAMTWAEAGRASEARRLTTLMRDRLGKKRK
jgi:GTP cyclohydrolase IA